MTPSFITSYGEKIELYDKVKLKDKRDGYVIEIFPKTKECMIDFDTEDFDSIDTDEILKKIS